LDAGWHYWTRQPVRIHWLAGDHSSILKPPVVSDLAQAIRQAMDQHVERHLSADQKTK
jgi:thioesterase domain-containing protein